MPAPVSDRRRRARACEEWRALQLARTLGGGRGAPELGLFRSGRRAVGRSRRDVVVHVWRVTSARCVGCSISPRGDWASRPTRACEGEAEGREARSLMLVGHLRRVATGGAPLC
eukprot:scaffold133022_cov81-Phaeocystis_antarctica.AAC.1